MKRTLQSAAIVIVALIVRSSHAQDDLAKQLRELDTKSLAVDPSIAKDFPSMLSRDARTRRDAANRASTEAWERIQTRADWERFRDPIIKALRESLGRPIATPKNVPQMVTGKLDGEGYRIENLVYESRPGLWVTANLYLPAMGSKSMPGIVICHSHHNPKTQSELQDMGILWARAGCAVLIMDQLGHGERRQHPFVNEKSFPGTFRPGRQDYWFRYNSSLQLYLVGESLAGWMAWDMIRGIDLLVSRPGVDKERIILMGSVAGGGDPTAVAAAIDSRIAAVVPFNFGGPQPETTYPLPPNAERTFNYMGGGSWESTRNLRLSGRDGFLPWVLVAVAPRRLIYAHEFKWDRDNDPVWKRLQRLYEMYEVSDRLAFTHGKGAVTGPGGPDNTHCNNIGAAHRVMIYPALKKWFDIPPPEAENKTRKMASELLCMTTEAREKLKPKTLAELTTELGKERLEAARKRRGDLEPAELRKAVRREWAGLLGNVEPKGAAKVVKKMAEKNEALHLERVLLETEPGIHVPLLLLYYGSRQDGEKLPVVVGVAQEGKFALLKERSDVIADLVNGRVAVCLVDVRGTGETKLGNDRGRGSGSTSISATELMLGQTMLGSRIRDLRSVLAYLRTRTDVDGRQVVLWGDSLAPVNPPDARLEVPFDAEKMPIQSEPGSALLALFGALYDDHIWGVYTRGGLDSFTSLLSSPFLWVPHDAVIPGALTVSDISDLVKAQPAENVNQEGRVDSLNRAVGGKGDTKAAARWMVERLRNRP